MELQIQVVYPSQLLVTTISEPMATQALNTAMPVVRQNALTWMCKSLLKKVRKKISK